MHEIMKSRRSVRKYTDEPVTDAAIRELLEAARSAPSGHNLQPWRFVVVRDEHTRQQLAACNHNQMFMADAPVHIVVAAYPRLKEDETIPFVDEASPEHGVKQGIRDGAIAATHILLQAETMGLGACWCGWHTQEEVRAVLHIPEGLYVVGIIPIGHPAETPEPRPRKELDELVHWEMWGE
ncbi:MAG: nitroreductase family protein [Bacillota bacterium]|nr:nitroreductase family protein [Bacillota bacterium]